MTRDAKVVVDFPNTEERARRLRVEVDRLARLPTVEWMFYLEGSAEKHGIDKTALRAMVQTVIKERAREDTVTTRESSSRCRWQASHRSMKD